MSSAKNNKTIYILMEVLKIDLDFSEEKKTHSAIRPSNDNMWKKKLMQ
jgi:hypothetical protein